VRRARARSRPARRQAERDRRCARRPAPARAREEAPLRRNPSRLDGNAATTTDGTRARGFRSAPCPPMRSAPPVLQRAPHKSVGGLVAHCEAWVAVRRVGSGCAATRFGEERRCAGYVRPRSGDVGDAWAAGWEEDLGELVEHVLLALAHPLAVTVSSSGDKGLAQGPESRVSVFPQLGGGEMPMRRAGLGGASCG
jgi:hypothetical protein